MGRSTFSTYILTIEIKKKLIVMCKLARQPTIFLIHFIETNKCKPYPFYCPCRGIHGLICFMSLEIMFVDPCHTDCARRPAKHGEYRSVVYECCNTIINTSTYSSRLSIKMNFVYQFDVLVLQEKVNVEKR